MAHFSKQFVGLEATGDSDSMACEGLFDKWVLLENLSAGTVNVQVSRDGSTWITVASRTTNADWVEVPQRAKFVRLNTVGVTGLNIWLEADNPLG